MTDVPQSTAGENQPEESKAGARAANNRRKDTALKAALLLVILLVGLGGGYLIGSRAMHMEADGSTGQANSPQGQPDAMEMMKQVNPPEGYTIPAVLGDIGARLVAAGGIDLARFVELYKQQNSPLTDEQMNIMQKGTSNRIVLTQKNAYFWLNFFWALGLTNQNEILTSGQMVSGGMDKVGGFASTGGWSLGTKDSTKLYASTNLISLTAEQQARLAEVAAGIYRPCCDNPTDFPDCNHGMAMLGLLELMASQNATSQQMYEAAKYVNAFWYPQQMLEIATAFKIANKVDFAQADASEVVSRKYSSASGFQAVHQYLAQNGLLQQAPGSGGSCGVK